MNRPERVSAANDPATRHNGRVSPTSPTGQRKLTLTLREHAAATVLHVDGDIDLATVPPLRDEALKQLQRTPDLLVLDFGDVGFLASAGLSTLTTLLDAAEPRTQLRIVAGPIAFRAIELSGLASELALFPTLDAALAPS
jgi:anti-sigma B factor antagonist